eukprot:130299-Pelagomonas_calceolata.AAC.5
MTSSLAKALALTLMPLNGMHGSSSCPAVGPGYAFAEQGGSPPASNAPVKKKKKTSAGPNPTLLVCSREAD